MQLSPYLSFDGQCEAAFKFYEQCLGGKTEAIMSYKEAPITEKFPAELSDKVMHAEFRLGDRTIMGSDCMPEQYEAAKGTSIMVSMKDPAEAERAFKALAEKGTVKMPMEETFWAAKFGMLVDQFGIPWMINCEQAPAA